MDILIKFWKVCFFILILTVNEVQICESQIIKITFIDIWDAQTCKNVYKDF